MSALAKSPAVRARLRAEVQEVVDLGLPVDWALILVGEQFGGIPQSEMRRIVGRISSKKRRGCS